MQIPKFIQRRIDQARISYFNWQEDQDERYIIQAEKDTTFDAGYQKRKARDAAANGPAFNPSFWSQGMVTPDMRSRAVTNCRCKGCGLTQLVHTNDWRPCASCGLVVMNPNDAVSSLVELVT